MAKIGALYICCRCGNTGFAGYVGGIDPFGKFEKLEGWGIWEGRTLCPDCAKEYHQRLKGFWKEEK